MKVSAYCRVSRDDLTNENQAKVIQEYCDRMNWKNITWFKEEQSTRKTRPIKEKLVQQLREGKYNILVFVRLDRFGRSTTELVTQIEELVNRGIRIISIQNGFDFNKGEYNSVSMLMLRVISAFAEFERAIIRERTLDGLARAKKQGRKGGRPKGSKDSSKRRKSGYWARWSKQRGAEN